MGRTTVLVDEIRDVAQVAELRAEISERPPPQILSVTFASGQSGLLDVSRAQDAVWADVLRSLQERRQPAYVEIDPETSFISALLLPLRFTVGSIKPAAERGALEVELVISHARHVLRRSNPDFARLRRTLQAAQEEGVEVLVTETPDEHEIIDVRSARETPLGGLG